MKRGAWDLLVGVTATASALWAPADLVLGLPRARLPVEAALSAVFLADLAVRARERRGWALLPDLLAALPLGPFLRPLSLLRAAKLLRVSDLLRRWREDEVRRTAVLRLAGFVYWFVLLTHGVACGWIALGGDTAGGSRYVGGLYWSVTTLCTVGYGDLTPKNDPQRLYACFAMLLGVGAYGFVIGNIASILANIDPVRASHLQRMEQIGAFLSYRGIPPPLQSRIAGYYRYLWQHRLEEDEGEILGRLPPGLRTEVALFLKRDLVQGVPLFRGASEAFFREIALEMRPAVYLPGDEIVRAGDRGEEMFFISHGAVEVVAPDGGKVVARLGPGQFFGEVALLHDRPRNATVRAAEYTDLYRLERALFHRVLEHHPAIAAEIRARAQERL
jgi:voltage-gated potassium channel